MKSDIPIEVNEAAGDWLDRRGTASDAERREFARWLLRSPTHVEEFLRLGCLRAELTGAATPQWVDELLARSECGVAELLVPAREPVPRRNGSGRIVRWLSAAAAIAGILLTGWLTLSGSDDQRITTALGEQRFLTLADGSTLELNTDSSIRIRMSAADREVELARGEVLIAVAPDPTRPFRVSTEDVTVEAIGTRFLVYRRTEDTLVSVFEGLVAVELQGSSAAAAGAIDSRLQIAAGEQVALSRNGVIHPAQANIEKVTAWTEQRLVFEDETLDAVVAEFNRYNRDRLLIGDAALTDRRITGVFDVNDPDEFIKVLDGLEPIDVTVNADGHRELHRGSPRKQ